MTAPAQAPPFDHSVARLTPAQLPHAWRAGCPVSPAQLRRVRLTYWGFDGKAHSGSLDLHADAVQEIVQVFRKLYAVRFPIRRMRPVDAYGANDDRSMAADNTSAFNCRYVGGEEARKVWSKHAYGTAIDVNDFENPYVDQHGRVYPVAWFLTRRSPLAGVFSAPSSASVQAFTGQGFRWGGTWKPPDFQHFDVAR